MGLKPIIIDVDFKKNITLKEHKIRYGDNVPLMLRVFDDGEPFNLSTMQTITLVITRLDRQPIVLLGTVFENQATFNLGGKELAVPGSVQVTAQFYGNDKRVSTFNFNLIAESDPIANYIPLVEEKTLIVQVLENGPVILEAAQTATVGALQAEETTLDAANEAIEARTALTGAVDVALESLAQDKEQALLEMSNEKDDTEQVKNDTLQVKNDTLLAKEEILESAEVLKENGDYAKTEGDRAKQEADRLAGTDVSVLDTKIDDVNQNLTAQLADKARQIAIIESNELSALLKPEEALKLNFISDDGHLSIYSGDKASNGIYAIKSDGSSGFVTADWGYNTAHYNTPVGVIVSDSIGEGHPGAHGRLDVSGGGYNLTKENERGQISYHLERLVGLPVINHGIGGQTSTQIRARWNRDVLAQDVTGLTPTRTLDFRPFYVVIIAGINDVFQNFTASDTISNLEFMIDSAISNNIVPVVFTIGPHASMDVPKLAVVKEVNAWLKEKALKTPKMAIYDFYEYANNPTNDGKPKSGLFADSVHPTKGTYQEISNNIFKTVFGKKIPKPNYLNLATELFATLPINSVSRPILVKLILNDVKQNMVLLPENEYVSIPLNYKQPIKKIGIQLIAGQKTDLTVDDTYLRRLFVSEFFITEKPFSLGTVSGDMVLRTTVASISVGRLLVDNGAGALTFANVENLKRVVGVNQRTTSGSDYIVTKGYAYINLSEANGTLANGDLVMTSTNGHAKKVNDIATQNPIGRVEKIISATFAVCELF